MSVSVSPYSHALPRVLRAARLQRQGVGRVGRDLARPHGRHDLVLADRPESRVRAKRQERRKSQHVNVLRQATQQQILGTPDRPP
jgi:hypothetical protein